MLANYNSQEAIDNDDGSSYYNTHHNYFVYGDHGKIASTRVLAHREWRAANPWCL